MRALRIATLLIAVLSLMGGTTVARLATTPDEGYVIGPVAGTLAVQQLPGGTFGVEGRIFQYREFPVAGSAHHISDGRLDGSLLAKWSWDIESSGNRPVPAWGTMTIDGVDGSWSGNFTGIRPTYYEPIDVRALLYGEGDYEGLRATLDITALELAGTDTWVVNGIVYPVDMTG